MAIPLKILGWVVPWIGLDGHPSASRCYPWEHETNDGKMRLVTMLHAPLVDSPQAAVRAAIVAEHREQRGEET